MNMTSHKAAVTAIVALLCSSSSLVVVSAQNLRRIQGKAQVDRIPLGVGGNSGPSLADGLDRFLVSFDVELQQPVYQGWTITLVFDKPITYIQSLEATLKEQSADNKTLVFEPDFWNKDLAAGHQWQAWQGVCDGLPLKVLDSYLIYDASITEPGPSVAKPLNIEAPPVPLHPAVEGEKFNLAKSIQMSILFYEVQRSGKMPANKRIPWRFDSELDDKGQDGEDLTGGWHDAGDHIKFGFPLAGAVSFLAFGGLEFEKGYQAAGEYDNLLDSIKWPLDWILKAHVKPDELYAQVSDKPTDHFDWTRPEDMVKPRKAYKVTCDNPGSLPVLESAAALAASSILFKKNDDKYPGYGDTLLEHSKDLFDFGVRCPGNYVKDGKVPADCCYGGGPWDDEEAWAAAWLHQATGEPHYLRHAEAKYMGCCSVMKGFGPYSSFGWDNKEAGVNMLLYKITKNPVYGTALKQHLDGWADGDPIKKTPKGLSYITKWGSLRIASNQAFLALIAAQAGLNPEKYRQYAKGQIYYTLGDCCRNEQGEVTYAYQMGAADHHPRSPHHRATSCDLTGKCECSDRGSYHILYGAIVGGPTENDFHHDKCPDFVTNEVAIDYNAGFQGALAGLKQLSAEGLLGDN